MHSPGRRISLPEALERDVSPKTRHKGRHYFLSGAVTSLDGNVDHITAVVEGTLPYGVSITREGDGFVGSCECPYFLDRLEICKHIWAAVLAADTRGWLTPDSNYSWIDPLDHAGPVPIHPRQAPPPPPRRERWEVFLEDLARHEPIPSPRPAPQLRDGQLVYLLNVVHAPATAGVPILLQARQRKKNGEWGQPQPITLKADDLAALPDATDREILPMLIGAADLYGASSGYYTPPTNGNFLLRAPLLHDLLPKIARTGRLSLRTAAPGRQDPAPLDWDDGPPWRFTAEVREDADDTFVLDGALVRDDGRMPLQEPQLFLAAGYLVSGRRLARFDHRGGFKLLTELRRAGALRVPRAAAQRLIEPLARFDIDPATLPPDLRYETVAVAPRPAVSIARATGGYASYAELHAAVSFDYQGLRVPADMRPSTFDAGRRRLVRRDEAAEAAALDRLQQLGVRRVFSTYKDDLEFVVNVNAFPGVVRTLVAEGWHVEAEGRVFRAPQTMAVQVKSGVDWFELHGSVDFGEGRSASIAELLASLKRGEASVLLGDGTRGMVPDQWLRKYLRIASFGETAEDHIRYRPTQAALLDALLEGQPAISCDETFARARAELQRFSGIVPLDPPRSFKGTLREYQREALGWFDFLRRFGFGGCLADDMGLGKTVMVLALLEARRAKPGKEERLPSLAVVPRSLVFNWKDEAARFAPKLRVLDYTGTSRDFSAMAGHDLVLTTYGTLRRDVAALTDASFDYVILDEAQAIKNSATAAAKAVRLLRARHRLALSGTPIENHIGELWSLFEFLNPGLLGSSAAFRKVSATTRGDAEDLAVVTRAVRPMILRRTKAQVEPELPARTEQTIVCELEGPQRKFYDRLRDHYRATLLAKVERGGIGRSKLQVLEALLRLRQAACHTALVDPSRTGDPSAKLEALLPKLQEVTGEGHKALVFSQFTSFLAIVRERLAHTDMAYEYLDGQTQDRGARVQRFNDDPDCRVFLISLKAGGVGLNLTAAEYVFLLDPWWNPAAEAQAIDRAHRIGQSQHVFAYRLIASDTVEEKVAELQQQKRELADAILTADPALIRTLTAEDLNWLLE
jgi:superfamily II DNA or RNA helicase